MDCAQSDGRGLGELSTAERGTGQEVLGPVHALFQRRVAGDDALLELAGLRFAQMGLAAEVYADTPGELEHVLRFVPPHPHLPVVHLNRGLNMLHDQSRAAVGEFADRFAGRIAGLVVHDKREMAEQTDHLLTVMRELDARLRERPDGPVVFLEYAAGLEPGWFVEVAERLQDAERVSCCIDVGHIGIRQASARFARNHPGLSLRDLNPEDGRLPDPFSYQGRRSLSMMYGPSGLASIVSAAIETCRPQRVSLTLEVHQVEGRLPLADASPLFTHWRDTTNAERMNYWLSVLGENALLVSQRIAELSPSAERLPS